MTPDFGPLIMILVVGALALWADGVWREKHPEDDFTFYRNQLGAAGRADHPAAVDGTENHQTAEVLR